MFGGGDWIAQCCDSSGGMFARHQTVRTEPQLQREVSRTREDEQDGGADKKCSTHGLPGGERETV